jgi:hypothetical protein
MSFKKARTAGFFDVCADAIVLDRPVPRSPASRASSEDWHTVSKDASKEPVVSPLHLAIRPRRHF